MFGECLVHKKQMQMLKMLCEKSKVNPWDHKIIWNYLQTRSTSIFDFYCLHSSSLLSNNSGYSCPVSVLLNSKRLNQNRKKGEKKGSQINRFHGAGHLVRENIRKCWYIPLICALSFAGFRYKAALEITAVLLFKMSRLHFPKQSPSSEKRSSDFIVGDFVWRWEISPSRAIQWIGKFILQKRYGVLWPSERHQRFKGMK